MHRALRMQQRTPWKEYARSGASEPRCRRRVPLQGPKGRLSVSLKALYECEWKTYETALDAAKRLGDDRARQALRAVVAHANEALDELLALASQRTIRLAAPVDVACELALRILQALA